MNAVDLVKKYTHWLHTQWPAGTVEKLPEADAEGRTNVPGLYVSGDLKGIPLLKFSLQSGTQVARLVALELGKPQGSGDTDLAIIGAGVSGMAAAMEAQQLGLSIRVLESSEPFFTLVNFPRQKPIYTYPSDLTPEGSLQVRATIKEALIEELEQQTRSAGIAAETARVKRVIRKNQFFELELEHGAPIRAKRVLVAIGHTGDFRRLHVPGEDLPKVYNRLHDPRDFKGQKALVVGGGDSALETAVHLARAGAHVTLSYRGKTFSRPKPENQAQLRQLAGDGSAPIAEVEGPELETSGALDFMGGPDPSGSLDLCLSSNIKQIREQEVVLDTADGERNISNDVVFVMIGREPPLGFFRRSGVRIRGEWRKTTWVALMLVLIAAILLYHWKTDFGIPVYRWFKAHHWFPWSLIANADPATLWGTLQLSFQSPSFYYSLAYSLIVTVFGWRRIRRRRTPYITVQTLTLIAVQVIPLFLLPYILLPWAGHNGWFDAGFGRHVADAFFPVTQWDPQGREYWRSVGFILAWPLMFWNVFTDQPLTAWLVVSVVQTFILIPIIVYIWGKGAYCGWICSCGALAETAGDTLRQKMPHGAKWNRLNMLGQGVLLWAGIIFVLRAASWILPQGVLKHAATSAYMALFLGKNASWGNLPFPFTFLNYNWIVDLTLAGILGVGLYVFMSGRMWCRFACPLAALMHIYARKSRFRILSEKKKCISCNVCTSVCHQGIDVMNFANKGLPMNDPECVRCSACVQSCPTGVLYFGQVDGEGRIIAEDRLAASAVRMREGGR
jgi:NosR/NirI family nitrous oxide reductase transcriptional regulator